MKSKLTHRYKSLRNPENENEFTCLLNSYLNGLMKLDFTRRFRAFSHHDLSMVKQQVLEELWKRKIVVKGLLEREEAEAYIWRTVNNRCNAHIRQLNKRYERFVPPDETLVHRHLDTELVEELDLEKVFGEVDDRSIVLDEICKEARLTPREKEVFTCLFEKYSRKDGAEKLNISENNYKKHLQNARKKLKKYLGKDTLRK